MNNASIYLSRKFRYIIIIFSQEIENKFQIKTLLFITYYKRHGRKRYRRKISSYINHFGISVICIHLTSNSYISIAKGRLHVPEKKIRKLQANNNFNSLNHF